MDFLNINDCKARAFQPHEGKHPLPELIQTGIIGIQALAESAFKLKPLSFPEKDNTGKG